MKGTLKKALKERNIKVSPQGILIISGNVAVAGVLPYQVADKLVGVLTPSEEMFNKKSIDSLEGVGVIVKTHQKLDDNNAPDLQVGIVTSAEPNGDFLKVKLAIWDEQAKSQIKNREFTELSCGYNCQLIEDKGYFFGSPYSYKKKNIVYNHVCIVAEGEARNGHEAKLTLDSNNNIGTIQADMPILWGHNSIETVKIDMKKIKIKDQEFELEDEKLASAIETLLSESEIKDSATVETAKNISELEQQIQRMLNEKPELIKLWLKAAPLIKGEIDYSMPPIDVMKMCIKERYPNTENAEEAVIRYLFNNMEIEQDTKDKNDEKSPVVENQDSNITNDKPVEKKETPKLTGVVAKATTGGYSSQDMSAKIANQRTQKKEVK